MTRPVSPGVSWNRSSATSAKMAWKRPEPSPDSSLTASSDGTPLMVHTRCISLKSKREIGLAAVDLPLPSSIPPPSALGGGRGASVRLAGR